MGGELRKWGWAYSNILGVFRVGSDNGRWVVGWYVVSRGWGRFGEIYVFWGWVGVLEWSGWKQERFFVVVICKEGGIGGVLKGKRVGCYDGSYVWLVEGVD